MGGGGEVWWGCGSGVKDDQDFENRYVSGLVWSVWAGE